MSRCALWGIALLLTLVATLQTPNAGGPAEVGNLGSVDRETLVWDANPLADRYQLLVEHRSGVPFHHDDFLRL